ncbi:hypothetical protein CCACVL1_21076 [Corchorus capsularis]|uniref:Uncharacterized protein n=1 Tax=Corchorus capsularis TaxID=210143 RepID=A0A1R3H8B3_COCAP|nr:hypothetical protein CCACVL1_21076 [Corchorus capsularis]
MTKDKEPKVSIPGHVEPQTQSNVQKLSQELNELTKQVQAEKKKGEMLAKAIKAASGKQYKPEKPIKELTLDELFEKKKSLEELREKLQGRVNEIEASSSLLLLSNQGA